MLSVSRRDVVKVVMEAVVALAEAMEPVAPEVFPHHPHAATETATPPKPAPHVPQIVARAAEIGSSTPAKRVMARISTAKHVLARKVLVGLARQRVMGIALSTHHPAWVRYAGTASLRVLNSVIR
jgi:hypothetical protein